MIVEKKQQLRQQYLQMRKKLLEKNKRLWDQQLIHQFQKFNFMGDALALYCYVSMPLEVRTHDLIEIAWKQHKPVFVPKCLTPHGDMCFYQVNCWEDFTRGYYGILEPKEGCFMASVNAMKQSICLAPCLAVDEQGYRLGYGKGYYDRFLLKYSGKIISLCYNNSVVSKLPHTAMDIPVDYIVTQTDIISTSKVDELL